jgi:two-component system sensor histidine kinase ChvG
VTWLALFTDRDSISTMRRAVDATAAAVAAGEPLDDAAVRGQARVSLVDAGGAIVAHADRETATTLRDRIGDLFFGPDGGPHLDDWESTQPPLVARAEVIGARKGGAITQCSHALEGRIAVCVAARATAAGVVVAERSSPRAIRALYDLRYPLLKLTLYVLGGALFLTAWLARTIVKPIEVLRVQVMERAGTTRHARPIAVRAQNEFADLAGAFNDLLRALDERARQNEAFTADLVHELKNPVAAVRACAEALSAGVPVDEARAARLGAALAASGRRLDALVTRFLELARAEAGLVGEPRDRIDLAALARGLVATVAADARFAAVRFEVRGDGACEVVGVGSRLESALLNVVENAASFAGEGGRVEVRVARDGDHVEVSVADSGPGIAPEHLERVFERFFTTRSEGRGTGLGLAMSRAVAEAHGGTLEAASPTGGGALFTFRLPAA